MDFPRALAILASPGVTHAHPGAPDPRVDAERTVQTYVDSPSCVPSLVSALVSDGLASAATRHLAAVLLSAAADRHWSALGDDVKATTRSGTLAALSRTDDRAELRALVHAADVVARHSATDKSPWSELLPALRDAAKSTHATHREAAMLLLGSLVESMGAHMNDHHAALVALFAAALRDIRRRRRLSRARAGKHGARLAAPRGLPDRRGPSPARTRRVHRRRGATPRSRRRRRSRGVPGCDRFRRRRRDRRGLRRGPRAPPRRRRRRHARRDGRAARPGRTRASRGVRCPREPRGVARGPPRRASTVEAARRIIIRRD